LLKTILENEKNVIKTNDKVKDFSDGEEAIIFAINELKFQPKDITIYVDESGRPDHFINMVRVIYKYGCKMIGQNVIVNKIEANTKATFNKKYKYLSMFLFDDSTITTSGLE